MRRTIVGFHADELGDWVAELSCLHGQHVRHQPPFRDRPWAVTEDGRASRIGRELDCPLCDRGELPDGLVVVRTAGPFDESTLPRGLLADHRVAARTWGLLRMRSGAAELVFVAGTPPPRQLGPGDEQPIPPEVAHHVRPLGPFSLEVDFLVRS